LHIVCFMFFSEICFPQAGPDYVKINENDPCTEYWPEIGGDCHDYLLLEVQSCENCHIIVEFCNRETSPGRGEYQITGIYGYSNCLLCPESDIYRAAYVKLLLEDPYGFTYDEQAQIVQQSACIDIYEHSCPTKIRKRV